MQDNLIKAKGLLKSGNYTCVVTDGKVVHTSTERGVKPLLSWLDDGVDLSGFSAADKVVGKAAANLYVLLGISCVYADVISRASVEVFEKYGIEYSYSIITDAIRNRTNTGFCPMEQAVKDSKTPDAALDAIRHTLIKLASG